MQTIICTAVFEKDGMHLSFCGNGATETQAFASATEQDAAYLYSMCQGATDVQVDACAAVWREGGNLQDFRHAFGDIGYTIHVFYNVIGA